MKKKALFSIIVPLLFVPLNGCSHRPAIRLTFGTELKQDIYTLKELSTSQLLDKTKNDKEVFLLATYQGSYSEDCLCWATYQNVIANYMNLTHDLVYVYNTQNIDDSIKHLNIEKPEDSTPCLYIFNGEQKVASFSYKNSKDKGIFEDITGHTMQYRVRRMAKSPLMRYVDTNYTHSNSIKNTQGLVVLFMRRGCGDCSYSIPNVLIPYIKSHKINFGVRIVDLQDLYDLSKKETASEAEKAEYQKVKDDSLLSASTSEKYGYLNGVVPTLQYYEHGELIDASVFFNDEIGQKEDGSYYISNSFYSQERLTSIKYADNVVNNVLKGMDINSDEVITTTSGYTYWAQEKAAQYHQPLMEAFLERYCK